MIFQYKTIHDESIQFNQYKVSIEKGQYPNGRFALMLIDATTGEELFVATVNIPDIILQPDEIIIKNWSENQGILEFSIDYGFVSLSKHSFSIGAGLLKQTSSIFLVSNL